MFLFLGHEAPFAVVAVASAKETRGRRSFSEGDPWSP